METKDIKKAIRETDKLLMNVPPDKRDLAFPVVLDRMLDAGAGRPSGEQPPARTRAKVTPREASKRITTRSELVRVMVRAGWFKKKRRIGEIAKELRRRGMKTPLTSLPALLLPMVLEGGLDREHDAKGVFVYFSK